MVVKTKKNAEDKKNAAITKYNDEIKVSIDEINDTKYNVFRDQSDTDAIDDLQKNFSVLLSDGDFFLRANNFTEAFYKFNDALDLANSRTSKSTVKTALKNLKSAAAAASSTPAASSAAPTGIEEIDDFLNGKGGDKADAIRISEDYSKGSANAVLRIAESFRTASNEAGDKPDARQYSFAAADALRQAEEIAKKMDVESNDLVDKLNESPPPTADIVNLVKELTQMDTEIVKLKTTAEDAAKKAKNTDMPPKFKKKKFTYL